jgi:hypothetical protein
MVLGKRPANSGVATVFEKGLQVNMFTPSAPRDTFLFANVNARDMPKLDREAKRSSKTSSRP